MKSVREIRSSLPDNFFTDLPADDVEWGSDAGIRETCTIHTGDPDDSFNFRSQGEVEVANNERNDTTSSTVPELSNYFEFAAPIDEKQVEKALNGGAGKSIRTAVAVKGVDALGYYIPFHYRGPQWGIYVKASGIHWLASNYLAGLSTSWDMKRFLAFRAIVAHESFHFAVEYMSSQLEAITGQPCYLLAQKELRKSSGLGYFTLEEALANVYMLGEFRRGPKLLDIRGKSAAIKSFVGHMPIGYRDALEYENNDQFFNHCSWLAELHLEESIGLTGRFLEGANLENLYPMTPKIDWRYCPLFVVKDEAVYSFPPLGPYLVHKIPEIVETERFRKSLNKLPQDIPVKWARTRDQLKQSTLSNGLDFKKWSRTEATTIFSCRVDLKYRVHLEYNTSSGIWNALNIGNHKDMGHG